MGLSVKVGNFIIDTSKTAGQTQTISGVGFTPKVVIFYWSGTTSTSDAITGQNIRNGWGASDGNGHFSTTNFSLDGATDSDVMCAQYTTRLLMIRSNASTTDGYYTSCTMNSDGFALTVGDQYSLAQRISFLAIGGTDITNTFVGNVTTTGTTGEYDITDPSFQPDVCLIGGFASSIDNTSSTTLSWFMGMATGSSEQGVVATYGVDAQATTDTRGYGYNGQIIMSRGTGERDAFVSFITSGVRLNHQYGSTARVVYLVAIKGGRWHVGEFNTRTDTNNISETGVGWQPIGLLCASANRAHSSMDTFTDHARISVGATDGTTQEVQAWSDEDNLSDTECAVSVNDGYVYQHIKDDAQEAAAAFSSFGSDGFTLTQSDAETSACWVTYLAFAANASGGSSSSSKSAYIKGQSSTSSNKPAYIKGYAHVTSNKPAYVKGRSSLTGNKSAYTRGQSSGTSNKSAYVKGYEVSESNKPAYVKGRSSLASNKAAYVRGGFTVSSNKPAYVEGRAATASNKPAFIRGNYGFKISWAVLAIPPTTGSGTSTSSNKPAYIKGITTGTNNKPAYIKGGINVNSNKPAYINGGFIVTSNKPAYVRGGLTTESNQHAYIAGSLGTSSNKSAYVMGGLSLASNKSAYINGIGVLSSHKSAYIEGGSTLSTHKAAYVKGRATGTDHRAAYIFGGSWITSHKAAYMKGRGVGTSSKPAFIFGYSSAGAGDVITLINSTGTVEAWFRVLLEGYTDGSSERAETIRRAIQGTLDHALGRVRKMWVMTIKVRQLEPDIGYGNLGELETLYSYNNPAGSPSDILTFIDHHAQSRYVRIIGPMEKMLICTKVEGNTAWFIYKLMLVEV